MQQESLVFYRKYRPKTFAQIINQEPIKRTLQNAVRLKRIGHAYLFAGPRGTGKTTLARIFSKTVNCVKQLEIRNSKLEISVVEPCNSCEICEDIDSGRAPDLIEIDAASNRGIDDIRELREGIKFSPVRAKYKVFIIDEAHQLTKEAFNALLKTLEEPPRHAIFILATTEPERMPATIVSRTQRFDFRRVTVHEIEQKILAIAAAENILIEPQAAHFIASVSEGSFRDAESLFSQIISFHAQGEAITVKDIETIIGAMNFERLAALLDDLASGNAAGALRFLSYAAGEGYDSHELSRLLLGALRKILVLKIDPELSKLLAHEHTVEEMAVLLEYSRKFDIKILVRLVRGVMQAHPLTKRSLIPVLPLELAIIEAYDNSPT
jgi:DNA polymerase-3 subunit gamma/tau